MIQVKVLQNIRKTRVMWLIVIKIYYIIYTIYSHLLLFNCREKAIEVKYYENEIIDISGVKIDWM